jgi:transglutaminase/protease-like cytokinesis protein 3
MFQLPCKTRATYSWSGDKKTNQLGFMEGDVIEIFKVVSDDIYFGESQRTKVKGFFPSKYVECNLSFEEHSTPSTPISGSTSKNTSYNSLFTLKKNSISPDSSSNIDMTSVLDKDSSFQNNDSKSVKKFTSSYAQHILDLSTLSTDTSSSSVFGHSDFSATSAGSYIRHKEEYENKLQSMMNSTNNYNNFTRKALNEIFEKQEKKKQPTLFQKFLGSKDDGEPSFDDRLYLSSIEKMGRININDYFSYENNSLSNYPSQSQYTGPLTDLERSKTVSGSARSFRAQRTSKEQPDLILKPHKAISEVNREAQEISTKIKNYDIDSIDFSRVDHYMNKVEHDPFETLIAFTERVILRKFKTELEISRAIYIYLTRNFKLIQKRDEKISTKRMFESEKINEILYTRVCTPHQLTWLFYMMADAAGLELEMILGYLKHPFILNETITDSNKRLIINHSWISIQVDGSYRFIDVTLGNPTNELAENYPDIWDVNSINEFYYLTRPFHILTTHNSRYIDQQRIVPPIDVVAQLSLPPLYPHAMISGITLHKFNSSIFHLKDYELYDFEIEIPADYIVQGKFKPFDSGFETVDSFVQIYNKNGTRIAHFQGIMSKNCPVGFIYILGKDEFSKKWNLLMSIPCFHVGKWKPITWVTKVPGLNGVDVYLKEPKLNYLKVGEQKFDIKVHAKPDYIKEVKEIYHGIMKIGLFPPNKQIIELNIEDNRFNGTINLNKTGSWRLGVLDTKMKRWKVISEWSVS